MKLSKKKLEELKTTVESRDQALLEIGNLEVRKAHVTAQAYELVIKFEEVRATLKDKYGDDVQIDMTTGEIVNPSNDLKKA